MSSRLTFESDEQIAAVATDLGPGFRGFEDRVRNSPNPVYVTDRDEGGLFGALGPVRAGPAAGIELQEIPVGDYLIVVPAERLIAPPIKGDGNRDPSVRSPFGHVSRHTHSPRRDDHRALHAVLEVAGEVARRARCPARGTRRVVDPVRPGSTDTSPGRDGCSASVPSRWRVQLVVADDELVTDRVPVHEYEPNLGVRAHLRVGVNRLWSTSSRTVTGPGPTAARGPRRRRRRW